MKPKYDIAALKHDKDKPLPADINAPVREQLKKIPNGELLIPLLDNYEAKRLYTAAQGISLIVGGTLSVTIHIQSGACIRYDLARVIESGGCRIVEVRSIMNDNFVNAEKQQNAVPEKSGEAAGKTQKGENNG